MKRYRIVGVDFDSTPQILSMKIEEDWEKSIKKSHLENKKRVGVSLMNDYGASCFSEKKKNLLDLGSKPFSILAFHNNFFSQVRTAFIMGAYYPALTGACSLGERILNHLILLLREDFRDTDEYKKVYNKDSFDKWDVAIDTLEKWEVLLPETVAGFKKLKKIRSSSIHFHPEVDKNDRELSLKAICCLQDIIKNQFSGFGSLPWIFIIPGEAYIKKEWEENPFVKKVYLKNCIHVGPKHKILQMYPFKFGDEEYPEKLITDEEYSQMRSDK